MTFLKNPDNDMTNISNSDDITRLQQILVTCSKLNFNNVTKVDYKYFYLKMISIARNMS
jgi:hypothetical protein